MLSLNFCHLGLTVNATMAILLVIAAIAPNAAEAQIVSDGTTDTQINTTEGIATITGGMETGSNLLHSFEKFSVPGNSTAHFNNSTDINNIFSRVTGGSVSEIDGLIKTNGHASLFLLNPSGIIFGANAKLDLGGSLIATTAESIIFENGNQFAATETNKIKPLLTVGFPIGLQYGANPGAIAILPNENRFQSRPNGNLPGLNVKSARTLALLGGDVSLVNNNLIGTEANVEISSIKSGQIQLQKGDHGWQFDYNRVAKFGQISINQAFIDASGIVNLKGQEINIVDNSIISNLTQADGQEGVVNIQATKSIKLDNGSILTQVGQRKSDNQTILGSGGDIFFQAPQITFTNGSNISSGTLSKGAGGNITVKAREFVKITAGESQIPSFLTTGTEGEGTSGQVKIETTKLRVQDGSRISASSGNENLPFAEQPTGSSGNLIINTSNLDLTTKGKISVSSFGSGDTGNIAIKTDKLNINTQGQIAANSASGTGGSINLEAATSLILTAQGQISTTAQRNGNGGNIDINTDNLVLLESATINADAQQGTGGNIQINTQGFFVDRTSNITASSQLGTDGIVEIITPDVESKIETIQQERSPFMVQKLITTGCSLGQDFAKNQFRNIGRGGVPTNPLEETGTEELLSDLGFTQSLAGQVGQVTRKNYHPTQDYADLQTVTEANHWLINEHGKIELVASSQATPQLDSLVCQ